jgi:hypothetical protein
MFIQVKNDAKTAVSSSQSVVFEGDVQCRCLGEASCSGAMDLMLREASVCEDIVIDVVMVVWERVAEKLQTRWRPTGALMVVPS